jgi:hypothetical protein
MKNIFKLLLLFTAFAGYSQANLPKQGELPVNEQTIIGKWVFHDLINDNTPEENAEKKEYLEGTFVELKSNKTYNVEIVMLVTGTWEFDPDNKTITTDTNRPTPHIWKVNHVYKDYIVLTLNDGNQQVIYKREK